MDAFIFSLGMLAGIFLVYYGLKGIKAFNVASKEVQQMDRRLEKLEKKRR